MADENPQGSAAAEDRAPDAEGAPEAASAAAPTADAGPATPAAASEEGAASEEAAAGEDIAAGEDAPETTAPQAPTAAEGVPEAVAAKRREMTGVVLSNKADKTIAVRIDRRVKHPVYGKIVRRSSKLAAHDERNECREGDVVTIVETRPISKTKSWRLGRIVERAGA